jgi:hypothetical protein
LIIALASLTAFAQRNPDLEKAQQLLAQKKYDAALKSIDAAAKKGGLERESMLTLLESRGLAQASLGQTEKAEESFRAVLQLEPKRELTGKYTGKVVPVIAAAKEWFKTNGTIEVGPLDPGTEEGRVKQVSLFVKNDPLKLVRKAKFYVRKDGGAWKPVEANMANGAAATDVDGEVIEWWAELLTERNDQLLFLGSAGKPIKQTAPAPVAVARVEEKKPDAPVAQPEAKLVPAPEKREEVVTIKEPVTRMSGLRTTGFVLMGVGVVAAGVGTYFGVTSNSTRETVKASLAMGGYDPVELYNRDQGAITNAAIANALWIGGGAVGLTGLLFAILGTDVVVTPGAGGGVSVSGKF